MEEKIARYLKDITELEAIRAQRIKDNQPDAYVHVATCGLRGVVENLQLCLKADAARIAALTAATTLPSAPVPAPVTTGNPAAPVPAPETR